MIRVLLGLVAGLVLAFAAVTLIPEYLPSWLGGRAPVLSVADTTLQAIQRQQRLTVMTARLNSTITSRQQRLGGLLSASKTLIIPGTIRYEVDLSALKLETMRWNKEEQTLTIFAPRPVIAGPEVDLTRTTEYKDGALLLAFTDVEKAFDTANRAAVAANMRAQGASRGLVDLADEAARDTIGRLFLLPLITAGHADARVKVTFVTPPRPDLTTPPQE
ncbi:hypothetical protein FHS79_000794 [Polymorphobacter multimanifer]|uniref:DUF4230 domain-containing protein n=1 Tax=Polymorphobacter multimanifer TaxID=1070431 RepID=A0A841L2V8_9SPHN|nr:DUF4230 domain-containing protein [Polymorphobacter multimanifer]MBB6226636.1 hypothetical protein [Polymorphobacter multimanifer]